MNCKAQKLVSAVISISLLCSIVLSACSNSKKEIQIPVDERETYVYSPTVIDFYDEDCIFDLMNAFYTEDAIFCVIQETASNLSSYKVYLYKLTLDGEFVDKIQLKNDINYYVSMSLTDTTLKYVTLSNKLETMDITSGEILSSIPFRDSLCGVVECDNGYVVLSIGKVDKYDNDDNLISTIENEDWQYFNGRKTFYQDGDKSYLLADDWNGWKYYELDFDNNSSQMVLDPATLGEVNSCYGQYVFNNEGEFLMDIENSRALPLTYWKEMNLQPEKYGVSMMEFIATDDEHFMQLYNYSNGISQLILYTYVNGESYSDRTPLVIGGFNCKFDAALNWAVYSFNTSQTEFRAYIEDYSYEFGWDSNSTAASQLAELTRYFNEGNAPDIFYGYYFDFNTLAQSGMTVEISQYMSESFRARMDMITPNIRALMYNDDECYSIFSAYQINGFVSGYDVVEGNSNLSIDQVNSIAEANSISYVQGTDVYDLTTNTIMYHATESDSLNVDELTQLMEFIITATENSNLNDDYFYLASNTLDENVLWNGGIYSILELASQESLVRSRLTYVGYPSIDHSIHPIRTFGEVGISSSSQYPDKCCEFIEYLLNDDVQTLSTLSCYIPVIDSELNDFVQYSVNHDSIPSDEIEYLMLLSTFDEVPEECAEDFLQAVNSVDMVIAYDWGLVGIVEDELNSYYQDQKDVNDIVDSLQSRMNLYFSENG